MPYINQDGVLVDSASQPQPPAGTMAPNPMPTPGPVQSMGQPLSPGLSPASNISIPPAGPPRVPQDPDTRAALWRNLMGDFIWSLATGASAGANAPPGQRNRAAFAGALMGPYQRQANATAIRDREAQAQLRISEAQNLFDKLGLLSKTEEDKRQQFRLEMELRGKVADSQAGKLKAEADLAAARTTTEKATLEGKVARGKLIPMGDGTLYDPVNKTVIPNTTDIEITDQMIRENPEIPAALKGSSVKPAALLLFLKPPTATNQDKTLADFIAEREHNPDLQKYPPNRTGWQQWRDAEAERQAGIRGTAYGAGRPVETISEETGQPRYTTAGEAIKTGELPARYGAPTVTTLTKGQQADVVLKEGARLLADIDEYEKAVGPGRGRITKIERGIGSDGKAEATMYTHLKSFAALQPGLHGSRGIQYQKEFEDAVGTTIQNPEALRASVRSLMGTAGSFKEVATPKKTPGSQGSIVPQFIYRNGAVVANPEYKK